MANAPEPFTAERASAGLQPAEIDGASLLFGRYRLERELGRGGMGRVMLAFDTKLRIYVAIKLVPEQFMADAEAAEDLRREVLQGIALTHPAVVRTHTFEQDEHGAGIVMEYVHGLTFTEWKERQLGRCFGTAELLPWLSPLCQVLDYAHREARVVHRDLKPRNIMVTEDGRLKVADFGISATLTDSLSRVTGAGSSSGTPAYMSPQQARGKKPSHLDDVYALGATLYDLLAGKPPFFRGHAETIYHQLTTEIPPSMAERRAELGIEGREPIQAAWEETIAACLAKDPAGRPQSCGEVLVRLTAPRRSAALLPMAAAPLVPVEFQPVAGRAARPRVVHAQVPGRLAAPRPQRSKLVVVAAVLVVLSAICAALYFGQGSGLPKAGRETPKPSPPGIVADVATPGPVAATKSSPPLTPAPTAKAAPSASPIASAVASIPKPPREIDKWLAQVDGIYQPKWQKEVC